MAEDRIYYVRCADGCLFESMTKEQILAAITQAVESHTISDVDTGFVTKIKEQNSGKALSFWVGTNAQYNALSEKPQNCFCIITDDATKEDLLSAIEQLQKQNEQLQKQIETFRGTPLNVTDGATTVDVSQFDYFILENNYGTGVKYVTLNNVTKESETIKAEGGYKTRVSTAYTTLDYSVIFTETDTGYTVDVQYKHNDSEWETTKYTDIIGYIRG